MFDAQHAKRPENERSSAEPVQKTSGTKQRTTPHTGDFTRIPRYTQAWGNLPPPWLRLPIQRKDPDQEEPLQEKDEPSTQRKENTTGLPDTLKAGIEGLSGISLDDVQVHYRSSKPAQVQALAYTQGADIHVGPGQEKHLPHEVWHVVQQKQGRVKPTLQVKGMAINDDAELEREAAVMGSKAINSGSLTQLEKDGNDSGQDVIQGMFYWVVGGVLVTGLAAAFGWYKGWIGRGNKLEIGGVPPQIRPILDEVLAMEDYRALAAGNYARTGRPLSIRWATSTVAHTGAFFDSEKNEIGISMLYDPDTRYGHQLIKDALIMELHNSVQDWQQIDLETPLAAERGSRREDIISSVYHKEKSEYTSVVRQVHMARRNRIDNQYTGLLTGGESARWASFEDYLRDMVVSQHYQHAFPPDQPLQWNEIEGFVTEDDRQKHDWLEEEMPPLYLRPIELLHVLVVK